MGVYVYIKRSPKLAKQITVEHGSWNYDGKFVPDGRESTYRVASMSYGYKTGWNGAPLWFNSTINRLERAWDEFNGAKIHHAVLTDNDEGSKIKKGAVATLLRYDNGVPGSVFDSPTFGQSSSEEVRIIGVQNIN